MTHRTESEELEGPAAVVASEIDEATELVRQNSWALRLSVLGIGSISVSVALLAWIIARDGIDTLTGKALFWLVVSVVCVTLGARDFLRRRRELAAVVDEREAALADERTRLRFSDADETTLPGHPGGD